MNPTIILPTNPRIGATIKIQNNSDATVTVKTDTEIGDENVLFADDGDKITVNNPAMIEE